MGMTRNSKNSLGASEKTMSRAQTETLRSDVDMHINKIHCLGLYTHFSWRENSVCHSCSRNKTTSTATPQHHGNITST